MASSTYLLHSQLPQPIRFKDVDTSLDLLQDFLDKYTPLTNKFTIDDDNVGRGVVCAFLDEGLEGVMVYAKKDVIKEFMTLQGFQCTLQESNLKPLIQCQK